NADTRSGRGPTGNCLSDFFLPLTSPIQRGRTRRYVSRRCLSSAHGGHALGREFTVRISGRGRRILDLMSRWLFIGTSLLLAVTTASAGINSWTQIGPYGGG